MYLDEHTVDDFLAGIGEAGLQDRKVVQTEGRTNSLSGGVDIKVAKGDASRETKGTTERTEQATVTPAAKFQRLYAHLETENESHWYYEALDDQIWSDVSRNSIIEVTVDISLTRLGSIAAGIGSFTELLKLGEQFTGEKVIDEKQQAMLSGMEQLAAIEAKKGIPVKMRLAGTPKYTLISYLNPASLKVNKSELTGEASAVVKILRKLNKGEKYEFFTLDELSETLSLNREQRRQQSKSKSPKPELLQDRVVAPGAIVLPLAVYR